MADAGWYMIGYLEVKCYYCRRELDGWEAEDDPWEEHLRRSGDPCPFIVKGKTAHEMTLKDSLELEADRRCYILKKSSEEGYTKYKEEAEKVKEIIESMGLNNQTQSKKAKRGRGRTKK